MALGKPARVEGVHELHRQGGLTQPPQLVHNRPHVRRHPLHLLLRLDLVVVVYQNGTHLRIVEHDACGGLYVGGVPHFVDDVDEHVSDVSA